MQGRIVQTLREIPIRSTPRVPVVGRGDPPVRHEFTHMIRPTARRQHTAGMRMNPFGINGSVNDTVSMLLAPTQPDLTWQQSAGV